MTKEKAAGAKASKKSADEEPDFDARLERLESLVSELEAGGLGLEVSIERYQEGIALLKGCHSQLEGYRSQVEELTRDAESALRPMEDGDPADGNDERRRGES